MVVTLILSGVPNYMSLTDLAYYFNQIFDTDEIGSFKAKEYPATNSKRTVALEFSSGFDAMSAQEMLNGYRFITEDGLTHKLTAKIVKDQTTSNTETRLECYRSQRSPVTYSPDHERAVARYKSDNINSPEVDLDAELQMLQKQLQILKKERKIRKAKKKLKREYKRRLKEEKKRKREETGEPLQPSSSKQKSLRESEESRSSRPRKRRGSSSTSPTSSSQKARKMTETRQPLKTNTKDCDRKRESPYEDSRYKRSTSKEYCKSSSKCLCDSCSKRRKFSTHASSVSSSVSSDSSRGRPVRSHTLRSPLRKSPHKRVSPRQSSSRHNTPPRKSTPSGRLSPSTASDRRFSRTTESPYNRHKSPQACIYLRRTSLYKRDSPRSRKSPLGHHTHTSPHRSPPGRHTHTSPRRSPDSLRSLSPYSTYRYASRKSPYSRYSPTKFYDRSRNPPSPRFCGDYSRRPTRWSTNNTNAKEIVHVYRHHRSRYDEPSTSKFDLKPSDRAIKYYDQTPTYDSRSGARIIELDSEQLDDGEEKIWRDVDEVLLEAKMDDEKLNTSNDETEDESDSSPNTGQINLIISMNVVKSTNSAKTIVSPPNDKNKYDNENKNESKNNTCSEGKTRIIKENLEQIKVKTEEINHDCDQKDENQMKNPANSKLNKENIEGNMTTIKKENIDDTIEIVDSDDATPNIDKKENRIEDKVKEKLNGCQGKPLHQKVYANPKFVVPIMKLLKQMKHFTKNIDETMKNKLIYVVKLKLRDRLRELMTDITEHISGNVICKLYRLKYDLEQDKELIDNTLKDIENGLYENLKFENKPIKSKEKVKPTNTEQPKKKGSGLKETIEFLKSIDLGIHQVNTVPKKSKIECIKNIKLEEDKVNDVPKKCKVECLKDIKFGHDNVKDIPKNSKMECPKNFKLEKDNVNDVPKNIIMKGDSVEVVPKKKKDDDVIVLENNCTVIEISDTEDECVVQPTENATPLQVLCLQTVCNPKTDDDDKSIQVKIEDAKQHEEISKNEFEEQRENHVSLNTNNATPLKIQSLQPLADAKADDVKTEDAEPHVEMSKRKDDEESPLEAENSVKVENKDPEECMENIEDFLNLITTTIHIN